MIKKDEEKIKNIMSMKKFLLIAIVAVGMVSCKKGTAVSPDLFGKWEVTRVYGGNILPADSVYKPGNGNILQFNSDSTYKRYAQGNVTAQGVYHIRKNGYKFGQNYYDELSFDNGTDFNSVITLAGDNLTIKPLIPDISTIDYQKIQN
jgi:hypothetical protein